ncbi:MAG TPA: hypothetical protein VNX01_00415 [Bacteroidia bacterium]|jgi:hypothetical protein|nr:hypothetical protein [Bacteroidia bacterium]
MQKAFKIIFVLSALGALFFSCSKKYPEDRFYYVGKSPEKRIVGKWLLTKYYINNDDSTDFLFSKYIGWGQSGYNTGPLKYQYGVLIFEVTKDQYDNNFVYAIHSIGAGGNIIFYNSDNNFSMNFLNVYGSNTPPLYPLIKSSPQTDAGFTIEKLTNISLKITSSYGATTTTMEFAKQ